MFCKVTNGVAREYSIPQLRFDNTNVSFPEVISAAMMAEYDMYVVYETPRPVVDPATTIVEPYTIEGSDTTWTQTWNTRPMTAVEKAQFEETNRANLLNTSIQTPEALYQAVSLLVQDNIDPSSLADKDLLKVSQYYKEWSGASVAYSVDEAVNYNNVLYRCVQGHTSQVDWNPTAVPALWTPYIDPTGPATAWVQPAGAHDAYAKEMEVTHNGGTWRSKLDANVWEPGVYGWVEIV